LSSITKAWDILPSKELTSQTNWIKNGDRYSAIHVRLLLVRRELDEYRDGNVRESYPVSVDSIEIETSHQSVLVQTDTMTAGLRYALSKRVLDQLSTKVRSELGAKVPGYSGKLGTELLAKEECQFTETLEGTFSGTSSFSITESEEKKHTIKLNPGPAPREAKLRQRYWPRQRDIYLHSFEALEFEYKKRWFWRDVRKTMKHAEPQVLGWPLLSIMYHEPQANLVVAYDPVENELIEPQEIKVIPLIEPMPRTVAPELQELSALAKLAFPVTKEERADSLKLAVARKRAGVPARQGSVFGGSSYGFAFSSTRGRSDKKAAAKKAAKKAPAKKAPAKKSAKKSI
jgi:hypothetical protein